MCVSVLKRERERERERGREERESAHRALNVKSRQNCPSCHNYNQTTDTFFPQITHLDEEFGSKPSASKPPHLLGETPQTPQYCIYAIPWTYSTTHSSNCTDKQRTELASRNTSGRVLGCVSSTCGLCLKVSLFNDPLALPGELL